MLGTRDNRHERNYVIRYIKGNRTLMDSGRTLEDARNRCKERFSKRCNKGEICQIYLNGNLIEQHNG